MASAGFLDQTLASGGNLMLKDGPRFLGLWGVSFLWTTKRLVYHKVGGREPCFFLE